MTAPEEALAKASERAAALRAEGRYPPAGEAPLDDTFIDDVPGIDTLAEWAVIEVDPDVLFSTRRLGGPVTALKRLLLRMMRQYHVEVEARQTRFNIALVERLRLLEQRLERLEGSTRE
ncbi:MAG TPA: hypothetical protein VGF21_11240 [Thermoleophilaceae bacterium]